MQNIKNMSMAWWLKCKQIEMSTKVPTKYDTNWKSEKFRAGAVTARRDLCGAPASRYGRGHRRRSGGGRTAAGGRARRLAAAKRERRSRGAPRGPRPPASRGRWCRRCWWLGRWCPASPAVRRPRVRPSGSVPWSSGGSPGGRRSTRDGRGVCLGSRWRAAFPEADAGGRRRAVHRASRSGASLAGRWVLVRRDGRHASLDQIWSASPGLPQLRPGSREDAWRPAELEPDERLAGARNSWWLLQNNERERKQLEIINVLIMPSKLYMYGKILKPNSEQQ